MSTTLTNGLKLPDKGSVDWYADMQSNYAILDGAVGTVAEHTSQIAGKAPAVHTHGNITNDGKLATASKALVTDSNKNITTSSVSDTELGYLSGVTSAIQTQLNSKAADADVVHKSRDESIGGKKTFTDSVFCEGSFFLWTNANVVKGTVPQTTIQPYRMYFGDAQNYASSLFNIDPTVGNDGTQTFTFRAAENVVGGDDARFALVYNPNRTQPRYLSIKGGIEPNATNTYDLGSSSYQWNNLYAKNYYYNGVAWGLDKANVWTSYQQMSSNPTVWNMKNTSITLGTAPSSNRYLGFIWFDSADTEMGRFAAQCHKNGNNYYVMSLKNSDGTTTYDGALRYSVSPANARAFYPEGDTDLGTTNNKWKTFNGINPGALSLPDYSNVVALDTTNWSKSGDMIVYTPTFDGWLQITIPNDDDGNGVKSNMISILDSGTSPIAGFSVSNILGPRLYFLYPVRASRVYWLYVKSYSGTITVARLVKCLGNV